VLYPVNFTSAARYRNSRAMYISFLKGLLIAAIFVGQASAQTGSVTGAADAPPVLFRTENQVSTESSISSEWQVPGREVDQASSSRFQDVLEHPGRIYKNDHDEYLQELWLLGRFHGQYHWTEASTGQDNGYETRRFRLGAQARILKRATLHAQMISGSDINPFYNGFSELWAQWEFSPEFAVTLGQQKHRFTHDRNVSSRYLNYLERSMLTNMFNVDYTPAVTIQGNMRDTSYYTGFFSNSTGQDMGKAFSRFDSGYSYLAAVYHDLGSAAFADNVTLHATYVHSDANQNSTNLNRFDNGLSGAAIITHGQASFIAELVSGIGSDNGHATGINLQPSYFLNNQLQVATRYQLAVSNNSNGLQPQRRYEQNVTIDPGNLYQAGYVGLNYYIAKHNLKLMTGLEYANMNGQGVVTGTTMVRLYFGPHSGGAFPMNRVLPHDYD
jgi:phosphate-selective porin OprO/OprP